MNVWVGMGRLTREPEVNYSQTGKAVTKFTLAIDRYSGKGKKEADFINCVAFGSMAETIGNYVRKGQKFLVKGSIRVSSYTNKAGVKQYATNVLVDGFSFVEKSGSSSTVEVTGAAAFEGMGTATPMGSESSELEIEF